MPFPATPRLRASAREESGQVLIFVVVAMVVLLGFAALAIDVGRAYYTQRALQASADAAALAGAQSLPDPDASMAVATDYSGRDGDKNAAKGVTGVAVNVSTKCLTSAPGCDPVNAVVVKESVTVPTLFAKVLGFDSFDISVKSTACSPCAAKPLDIMLVLDRTASMCLFSNNKPDPACTDINNAKTGMKTFLGFLDASIDHVGLAVLPPGPKCGTPSSNGYDDGSPYVLVPLSDDYIDAGALNKNSDLVKTIECQKAGGGTAYATAIDMAEAELENTGRADVQHIIVFLSDGAANTGPKTAPPPYLLQPCAQGIRSADLAKAKGTLVYSIGYDLNAGAANDCKTSKGKPESPAITATEAMQGIASPGAFYNQPDPGELKTIFTRIAADISRPNSRLVDNGKA
jgi:hypothetical protein